MNLKIKVLFVLFLFILVGIKTYGQETWEDDSLWVAERNAIIAEINNIFINLDKSKFPTGFLYDRVPLPVSGIEKYNGLTDSLIDTEKWLQLYYELTQYASLTPEQFISVYKLDSIIRATNTVPIGIISFEYDQIKKESIDSGWLYVQNNQLFENPNASQSPYEKKVVFAITPLKRRIEPTVKYKIDANFLITNIGNNIQNLQIDFGDGNGYQTVTVGQEIIVNYSGVDNVQLSAKALLNSQSVKSFTAAVSINQPSAVAKTGVTGTKGFCSDISKPDAVWEIQQSETKGRAYIKYGCGNSYIDKPLIFVEGIDFGDKDFDFNNNLGPRYGDFGWVPQISDGKDPDDNIGPDGSWEPDDIYSICKNTKDLIN